MERKLSYLPGKVFFTVSAAISGFLGLTYFFMTYLEVNDTYKNYKDSFFTKERSDFTLFFQHMLFDPGFWIFSVSTIVILLLLIPAEKTVSRYSVAAGLCFAAYTVPWLIVLLHLDIRSILYDSFTLMQISENYYFGYPAGEESLSVVANSLKYPNQSGWEVQFPLFMAIIIIAVFLLVTAFSKQLKFKANLAFVILFGIVGTFSTVIAVYFIKEYCVWLEKFKEANILTGLSIPLGFISAFALLLPTVINKKLKRYCNAVWFIPGAVIFTFSELPYLFSGLFAGRNSIASYVNFTNLTLVLAFLLFGYWYKVNYALLADENANSAKTPKQIPDTPLNPVSEPNPGFEPSPVSVEPVNGKTQYTDTGLAASIIAELELYGDLYRRGIISEEENNAKRKQVLGL